MSTARQAKTRLRAHVSRERALGAKRFFKTARGEYGYGDRFIGVTVPDIRRVAREFSDLPEREVEGLLSSGIHEERSLALIILVNRFEHADEKTRGVLFALYLSLRSYVNNWDLVDISAARILGEHARQNVGAYKLLQDYARKGTLWERRMAVVATHAFIKNGSSKEIFSIARILMHDSEDLIQKAVGWMLREVGKNISLTELECFLDENASVMPRTMLRYALEHMSAVKKSAYMKHTR